MKSSESQPGAVVVHRASGDPARVKHLGPYGIESLIDPGEEDRATAYRVTIGPRQSTRISVHRIAEEFYYVIAGRGTAILNGVEHALKAGDFLRLPAGTLHGFRTDDDPLDMLNTHTPGCRPDRDVHFPDGPAPAGFGPGDGRE